MTPLMLRHFQQRKLGNVQSKKRETKYWLACWRNMVQPFDLYLGPSRRKDRDLGLSRLGKRSSTEFVPLESIVRGALIVPDFDREQYLFMDLIDADIFIRVKELQGN